MTLHDFIQQEQQNVGKTPPMLLQLRRIAIRQFPGKQIALYSNPQLKIQLAIPYDTGSGVLHASNMVPVAVHENLTPVHAIEAKKKQEFETHLANIAKNVGVEVGVKKHERNAARYAKLLARTKPTDLGEAIMPIGKHYPVHINNPKSPYHAKFGYVVGHEKETGRLHVAVHGVEKPITFE
ncbi:MAG: hypothetical protein ACREQ5_09315, partial [Candidatus Dormibacteria bacterium]